MEVMGDMKCGGEHGSYHMHPRDFRVEVFPRGTCNTPDMDVVGGIYAIYQ